MRFRPLSLPLFCVGDQTGPRDAPQYFYAQRIHHALEAIDNDPVKHRYRSFSVGRCSQLRPCGHWARWKWKADGGRTTQCRAFPARGGF